MHVTDPRGGCKLNEGCHNGAHQQLILEGMDSIDQSQAITMGGPCMHHEEGCLNRRHDAVHQHPVELQHCALLPPQVLLEAAASRVIDWQK